MSGILRTGARLDQGQDILGSGCRSLDESATRGGTAIDIVPCDVSGIPGYIAGDLFISANGTPTLHAYSLSDGGTP